MLRWDATLTWIRRESETLVSWAWMLLRDQLMREEDLLARSGDDGGGGAWVAVGHPGMSIHGSLMGATSKAKW